MNDNKRIGLYISDELLDLCDRNIGRDDSRSRSEFVCNAIEFYIASLDKEMVEGFLSPALEAVISARVKDTENRLARVVFKQSVELAMLIHILAGVYQSTPSASTVCVRCARIRCPRSAASTRSRISFGIRAGRINCRQ